MAEFLRSKLENELGAEGGTTKCVELGGDLVTRGLSGAVTSTGSKSCSFPVKCNIDPDQNCAISRNVYEVECTRCIEDQEPKRALYTGTSGHSLHKHQIEHLNQLRRGQNSNALVKHQKHKHRDRSPRFKSKVVKGGIQYNLDRFITEAYYIDQNAKNPEVNTLNQRGEWGNRGLVRLDVRSSP